MKVTSPHKNYSNLNIINCFRHFNLRGRHPKLCLLPKMLDKNSTLVLQIKNILITMFSLSCSQFKCQYVVELAPKKITNLNTICQVKNPVVDPFILRTVLHFYLLRYSIICPNKWIRNKT